MASRLTNARTRLAERLSAGVVLGFRRQASIREFRKAHVSRYARGQRGATHPVDERSRRVARKAQAATDPHVFVHLPRSCHVTGDIGVHEIAWAGEELWIVNTRFSCLCTLHPDYSFVPRWQPPFITALAAEDRCHLNGLALAPCGTSVTAVAPKYVTALGDTDTPGG